METPKVNSTERNGIHPANWSLSISVMHLQMTEHIKDIKESRTAGHRVTLVEEQSRLGMRTTRLHPMMILINVWRTLYIGYANGSSTNRWKHRWQMPSMHGSHTDDKCLAYTGHTQMTDTWHAWATHRWQIPGRHRYTATHRWTMAAFFGYGNGCLVNGLCSIAIVLKISLVKKSNPKWLLVNVLLLTLLLWVIWCITTTIRCPMTRAGGEWLVSQPISPGKPISLSFLNPRQTNIVQVILKQ